MITYEMLYILDNSISDEEKEASVQKFVSIIESFNGKVLTSDKWGTKKLAYPIDFKNEGYYGVITYEAEDGSSVKELNRVAGISAEVLRVMITKKD